MPYEDSPQTPGAVATKVLIGALGLTAVYLAWSSLPWPLIHDAPILHYVASRIGAGAVPYRDLFDMNQPGAYLVHAVVLRLLGASDIAWRGFDLAWLAVTALLAARFARPWGVGAAAGAAALVSVYHLAGGAWQVGQRDFLLCAFLLAASLAVATSLEGAGGVARLALGGLAVGAGIVLKPHAAMFAVALGVLVLIAAVRRRAGIAGVAAYAAGVGVAPVAAVAWLVSCGAFGAWREIVVDYLVPLYSRLTRPEDWRYWRGELWIALGAAVVLSIATAVWTRRFGWRHGIAVIGLLYGLAHFLVQRKGWEYHLYPLGIFAAVLAFSEVERLLEDRPPVAGFFVAAALVATVVLVGWRGWDAANATWIWDKERVVRLLVNDVAARRKPGDRMQVLDTTEGGVHALLRLGMQQPTRFLYDFHFFHDVEHPTVQRLRAELVRDLGAAPPRFVAVFENGWPAGKLDRIDRFPALARFLEEGYAVAERRTGYVLLEKRQRP